ncbi:MAG TPA: MATE family efflux transporter [Lachnospiraceae bacterium]|nr:MATE family efflux transporter [Lachnospiraceae bacterium]
MAEDSKRRFIFEEAPVARAVMALAVPSIITQLINIVYNYADTWYVGRTGNAAMVAALSVCFPIFVILAAIANLFGIGGASVISRSLGMRKPARARKVFAFCLFGGLAASLIYAVVMLLFRRPRRRTLSRFLKKAQGRKCLSFSHFLNFFCLSGNPD